MEAGDVCGPLPRGKRAGKTFYTEGTTKGKRRRSDRTRSREDLAPKERIMLRQ